MYSTILNTVDNALKNPLIRRTGLAVILFFLITLDAVVDVAVQPDLPFFNKEHIIVGIISGGVGFFFMALTAYLVRRLARSEYEREALVQHYDYLSKYANDIVILSDENHTIIEANDRALSTYGYTIEELRTLRPEELRVPEERALFKTHLARVRAENGLIFETRHQRRDGTPFPVEVSARVFMCRGRKYYQSIIRDISERKLAERALYRQSDRLRGLAARAERIREEERKLLAREIHDQLGQELTAIKMNLAVLAARTKTDELASEKVRYIRELVDMSIVSVRKISHSLRPGVLEELGLGAAIASQARDFEKQFGISCTCRIGGDPSAVKEGIPITLYRILQESLTNVARHAEATHVAVEFASTGKDLRMSIEDNGRGICLEEYERKNSLGILGMKERAFEFGGSVEIIRLPKRGTRVSAFIPGAVL